MRLQRLHEDGSWMAVAGHPGKLGNASKINVRGKGKKRMSFLTHPEDRKRFLKNMSEDDDVTEVGSAAYANDTMKHVPQGGTPSKGAVGPCPKSDIGEVGTPKYAHDTVKPSRKWLDRSRKPGIIGK